MSIIGDGTRITDKSTGYCISTLPIFKCVYRGMIYADIKNSYVRVDDEVMTPLWYHEQPDMKLFGYGVRICGNPRERVRA